MTRDERVKVKKCFGTLVNGLAVKTGISRRSMRDRLRRWLDGTYSEADVLLSAGKVHKGGPLEKKYGFKVQHKAIEMGLSPAALWSRIYRMTSGLTPLVEEDINEGLSADRRANLAKLRSPGTWERQNLQ